MPPMASTDSLDSDGGLAPPSAHTLSLLTARRPSFASPSGPLSSFNIPETDRSTRNVDVFDTLMSQYESPIARPDFNRGLQIKMQDWVGDSVTKMTDECEPQWERHCTSDKKWAGGTWDVADVQWNPHPARANSVVSTSSEKLIIWNLDRPDRSAIRLILSRHYRSITDLNWHNHNPDIVASTGIDSWIWMWDLRAPGRPVTGLCAFNPGATQVKWNRHDENILASSHGNSLLIWDQRKGAVPLTTIKAHTARIHGIDWSRRDKDEIASCSLDKTIKFWNTSSSNAGMGDAIPRPLTDAPTHIPRKQIDTSYPVWRARHVPFGEGVLSLPQRGIKRPELFYQDGLKPIEIMTDTGDGQADVVKEYVWRSKGGTDMHFDDREFQLVTWSEDRTLRVWPIDSGILEEAGFQHGAKIEDQSHRPFVKYESYRSPPSTPRVAVHNVSAPIGGRNILAGVRASTALGTKADGSPDLTTTSKRAKGAGAGTGTFRRGGTMTKGTQKPKRAGMHALAWIPSVSVGEKKEGSGANSLASSRLSLDYPASTGERGSESPQTHPSNSSDIFESEATLEWQDELIAVVNGFATSKTAKISVEKMDIQKRMCTLGLQGPWGESSSVFIRVTFVFPRDYARSSAPQSLPHIDLEKNHLIPVKNRTFLLRELRELRKKPPCLGACLRFLLGMPNETGIYGRSMDTDSGSSSGEENGRSPQRRNRGDIRGQTGLAEPRTSQGVFGPNGELVCFSHLPLRMMRTTRNISLSPSTATRIPRNSSRNNDKNRSSGVLSDALRRLSAVAHDRQSAPPKATSADEDLLRALESLAQPRVPVSEAPQSSEVLNSAFFLRPTRKGVISIRDVSDYDGLDLTVAKEYAVSSEDPGAFCQYNARIAHAYGRYDHERVFNTLQAFIGDTRRPQGLSAQEMFSTLQWRTNRIGRRVILSVFEELSQQKDLMMLAMMSVALLLSQKMAASLRVERIAVVEGSESPAVPRPDDYFALSKTSKPRTRKASNASYTSETSIQSPTTPGPTSSLSSSASSRGSWSSILNASASSVRFLMSGEGTATPKAQGSPIERSRTLPIVVEGFSAGPKTPEGGERKAAPVFARQSGTPKSWSEPPGAPPARVTVSFSSAGHVDSNEVVSSWGRFPRKHVVAGIRADLSDENTPETRPGSTDTITVRLVEHIIAYSEFLFRWKLLHKRAELLKCLPKEYAGAVAHIFTSGNELVTVSLCPRCGAEVESVAGGTCTSCKPRFLKPACAVCRLPATGLAHVCLVCCHTTHLRCWSARKVRACPTGCGCECVARGGFDVEVGAPHSTGLG